MAYYYSKRKLRPKEEEEAGELNIVPYLDILMNLIIFMLLSMTGLATFGILNVSAPNYGGAAAAAPSETENKSLLLTVAISKKGHFIAATGAVIPGIAEGTGAPTGQEPTIPRKADAAYDYASLNEKMKEIKAIFPNESKIIIAADMDVPFEVLIGTMDACRETVDHKLLFPDVTLGAF